MGRLKIDGELRRRTLAITLPPELIKELRQVANKRIMSVSALMEAYVLLGMLHEKYKIADYEQKQRVV